MPTRAQPKRVVCGHWSTRNQEHTATHANTGSRATLDTGCDAGYVQSVSPGPLCRCFLVLLTYAWPLAAQGQNLVDLTGGEECTTIGTEGISAQLTRYHECQFPDGLARLGSHPSIELASERTYDLVTTQARAAIVAAADQVPLRVSVAYRPVSEQYVMYKTSACATFEKPGADIHQSGKAVDVQNWEEAATALVAAGCTQPDAEGEPLHFECPGADMRDNAVLVFQRLWNLNRPADLITEDGIYGPQTEGKLAMTPANGFANPGCAAPAMDAGADASVTDDAGMVPPYEDDGCSISTIPTRGGSLVMLGLVLGLVFCRRNA